MWTRDAAILSPASGFDAWTVGGPAALRRPTPRLDNETPFSEELALWYFGAATPDAGEVAIGLATARCKP